MMIDNVNPARLTPLPGGKIAAIVTYLEMKTRGKLKASQPAGFSLRQISDPDPDRYRTLFRAIGRDYLWVSRLQLADQPLRQILSHPATEIHALIHADQQVGLLELDRSVNGQVEIAYLGLVPQMTGRGLGKWLMAQALNLSWRPPVARVWLHTCTLDHPAALSFYLKCGFVAYKRAVEILDDPRLTGHYDHGAAPHIPLFSSHST